MKKNSKKRVLLSSVAMLMVGAISLGTATYAWFTQTTQAKASNINVTATKASSLKISDVNKENWASAVDYDFTQGLYPASSSNGKEWFRADATNEDSFAATSYQKILTEDNKKFYRFDNMLNVKNEGGQAVNDVKYSFTFSKLGDTTLSSYARVAFIPCTSTGEYTDAMTANFLKESYVFAPKNADQSYNPIALNPADTANGIEGNAFSATEGDVVTFKIGNLAPGEARYYKLFVWFEGQDENCKDANQGQTLDLDITVSGTPVIAG